MANEIKAKQSAVAALTMTLTAITAAQGRLATQVNNKVTLYQRIYLYAKITSGGTAPAAGNVYKFFLIRSDNHATQYVSEGLGLVDADVSAEPANAEMVMSVVVTNDANTEFFGDGWFDNPGPEWSIVMWNATDQTIHATEANHFVHWVGENPEVQ